MNNKLKIVFFDSKEIEEKYLRENLNGNFECLFIKDSLNSDLSNILPQDQLATVYEADIVSVFTTSKVSSNVLSKFPNLKLVTTRSTGFNHVDSEYCKEHNIPVVNVPRYGEATIAEFSFGLMLNVMRKIDFAYQELKSGRINIKGILGNDLFEKTIGIVGTGAIGYHAIAIAKGFGMKVIAYDLYPKQELIEKYDVEYMSLDDLCSKADVISVHAPSTKETYHLIGESQFSLMKDGVVIVNTARGEIIDTESLYRSLKSGKVAGAGLDVLECEDILLSEDQFLNKIDCANAACLAKTLLNHKFLELPNVIVTPHIAFDSVEAVYRILKMTIININSFVSGDVLNRTN